MPEYQLTIWVAFITAAAGLLGAIVGGFAAYKTTTRTLQYQEKVERRERELTRFEGAFDSVLRLLFRMSEIAESVTASVNSLQPIKLPESDDSPVKVKGRIVLVVCIYAPELKSRLDAFEDAADVFIDSIIAIGRITSLDEKGPALERMNEALKAFKNHGNAILDGLEVAARKHLS